MKQILLTQGKSAIVSSKDFEYLNKFKWHYSGGGNNNYARRKVYVKGKFYEIRMHREILERQGIKLEGLEVDHINRNGLDNRRENLRACTRSQNQQNSIKKISNKSGYKGVVLHANKKWRAQINIKGRTTRIGDFKDKVQAAIAYNEVAKHQYGEFARLNTI